MKKPHPGSDEARKSGCVCPIIDNAYGKGAWGTEDLPDDEKLFFVRVDCPLHGNEVGTKPAKD